MRTYRLLIGMAVLSLLALSLTEGAVSPLDRSFFIDEHSGMPNCIIIVGEQAAVSDVIAASWIATQVGAMSYIDESVTVLAQQDALFMGNEELPNAQSKDDDGIEGIVDFSSSDIAPASYVMFPYSAEDGALWDYDVYLDAFSDIGGNWLVDTGNAYESIAIDLSIRDTNDGQAFCEMCSAAKQQTMEPDGLLSLTQTYPTIFPRHYWGTVENDTTLDPVGGVSYRSVVYDTPPQADEQFTGWAISLTGYKSPQYTMITDPIPAPSIVPFLGNYYNIYEFGTDALGYDYALYGTPLYSASDAIIGDVIASAGGSTIEVQSIDVYKGEVTMTVTGPDVTTQSATIKKDESLIIYDEVAVGIVRPVQCITLSTISIRAQRTASLEIITLDDYGVLTEHIYDIDEPYVVCNGLEWYLDIMPADDVQQYDKDNDITLFNDANPSYSASDNLSLYESQGALPYLEVWMATPVELVGILDESLTGCLNNEQGEEIMSFEIMDVDHRDTTVDSVTISQHKLVVSNSERFYIDIDTSLLAITDSEVGPEEKSEYNLVLIGGPVANRIVGELLALGITDIATWTRSSGDVILYQDVFVTGKDVLIVAGKDREATTSAARTLLDIMGSM